MHCWGAPEQRFQWLRQDVGRKNTCTGHMPREQLYWDLEIKRESGLFLSLGCNAALTASYFGVQTSEASRRKGNLSYVFLPSTEDEVHLFDSRWHKTISSLVFHLLHRDAVFLLGRRQVASVSYCWMAFFPRFILLSGLGVWNWKHNF